ncbi:MAG: NTE family protein, partial [Myxococcota bacterium]
MASPEQPKIKRAIVLAGGGARGAYEAGVLSYILEEIPKRLGKPVDIDIVCGTSVGAIHAAFLAATADVDTGRAKALKQIWENMRVDEIFQFNTRDILRIPSRLLGLRRVAR